jgi:ElaA protein
MTTPITPAASPAVNSAALDWHFCAFADLTVLELEQIYTARQQVFSIEQNCVYLDADGRDSLSHHLTAWSSARSLPVAYARLVAPGVAYAEPSMGRVITTAAARGQGLGRELVRRVIEHAQEIYPGQGLRISAQSQLEVFYGGLGFVIVGERYLEDGIPHTEMLMPAFTGS